VRPFDPLAYLTAADVPPVGSSWHDIGLFAGVGHGHALGHYGSIDQTVRMVAHHRDQWMRGGTVEITLVAAASWLYALWLEAALADEGEPRSWQLVGGLLDAMRDLLTDRTRDHVSLPLAAA
jgi:hypothetical protein